MDTNKARSIFKYLKGKYGEDSVKQLRNWEVLVRKMADFGNHRYFAFKCIKVRITPVSCKIRNPLQNKTQKRYQIIHKAERRMLYERVRNINSILNMYKHNQSKGYIHLKNIVSEDDLYKCIHFINMIKEHRHDNIKKEMHQ